jgi:predicted N-acyltransferase
MHAPVPYSHHRPPVVAPLVRNDVPLSAIAPDEWNALAGNAPLLSHQYFSALHDTGCASPATGWEPRFLTAWDRAMLIGAMPLYAKSHSYGEYVFDWGWADAYRRYGRHYYPKLVSAVPFTPVPGPRMLAPLASVRRAQWPTRARRRESAAKRPREAVAANRGQVRA